MEKIAYLEGTAGVMTLFEDRIVYNRDQFMNHSENVYFLKNVSQIQFSKPTFLMNGYVRVLTANSKSLSNDSMMKLAEDPDTLFFRKKHMEAAKDFCQKANELIAKL